MYTPSQFPPTSVSVDLNALAQNVAHVRRLAPHAEVLAVVKANAYGHGALELTRALQQLAVHRFGVATVDEGIALRQAGIHDAIVVMGPTAPAQFADLTTHRLTPVLYRTDMVQAFASAVPPDAAPYSVHVKIETGMGRLGVRSREMPDLAALPAFQATLRLEGLMTHLADADNAETTHTEKQLAEFQQTLEALRQGGRSFPLIHAANSAGIIKYPASLYSLVRPGIMLYGYHTLSDAAAAPELRPILTWRATIAHVHTIQPGDSVSYNRTFIAARRSRIAVLPVGYADGYNRLLSNRGMVLIGGRRVPVVGRVCMDMTMVDVTDVPGVQVGQEAILIGQQGDERITAADLATWQQTIPYEVLCAIGQRVPRHYLTLRSIDETSSPKK
ncbi:MAG: alanine racemase [Nitrospira sp.]|mgnify:CR=1 FL=1|nr:alanine racemase [Nitrospira sp.]HQY58859.1 alanine racemase [Nitrospira sp.]HRA98432.1 alanine racemase [Nitrospira sp.]